MQGSAESEESRGIIPRMSQSLFDRVRDEKVRQPNTQFLITVSYFEIYNEVIFDLLDASDRKKRAAGNSNVSKGLEIKEHPALGVYVKGLLEFVVEDSSKMQSIIDQGMRNRTTAGTAMNADSSRSHSVFTITVHQKQSAADSEGNGNGDSGLFAKINLVDLAGSERQKSTGATGDRLKEGANINKSLSALGNVINALVEGSKSGGKGPTFVPYRNSKLTRVLQESLGGNSLTTMLAALSPAASNLEETLSTLKYANRAKDIKVKAVKNEEASQVTRLQDEIRALKERLMAAGNGSSSNTNLHHSTDHDEEADAKGQQMLKELEQRLRSTWESKAKESAAHEAERARLLQEQANAAKQLTQQRERNFQLMAAKALPELTLAHLLELPSTSSQAQSLASLQRLKQAMSMMSIVEKKAMDGLVTFASLSRGLLTDRNALLLLQNEQQQQNQQQHHLIQLGAEQLTHKTVAITDEASKWLPLVAQLRQEQSQVMKMIRWLVELSHADLPLILPNHEASEDVDIKQGTNEEEQKDLRRGLLLLFKQLQAQCQQRFNDLIQSGQEAMDNFKHLSSRLVAFYNDYEVALQGEVKAWSVSGAMERINTALAEIKASLDQFAETTLQLTMAQQQDVEGDYVGALPLYQPIAKSSNNAFKPMPHIGTESSSNSRSAVCWVQQNGKATEQDWLTLDLTDGMSLAAIQLLPCRYRSSSSSSEPQIITADPSQATPPPFIAAAHGTGEILSWSEIRLPSSGLTLSTCNGDAEVTLKAIAEVLDWSSLLKTHDPIRFLRRPPVRFLFDLFQVLANAGDGHACPESIKTVILSADWATLSQSREGKVSYMDNILSAIAVETDHMPLTATGSSIVAGSEVEATNLALQRLALAMWRQKQSLNQMATTLIPSSSSAVHKLDVKLESQLLDGRPTGLLQLQFAKQQPEMPIGKKGIQWKDVTFTQTDQADQIMMFELSAVQKNIRNIRLRPSFDNAAAGSSSALSIQLLSTLPPPSTNGSKNDIEINASSTLQQLQHSLKLIVSLAALVVSLQHEERLAKAEETRRMIEAEAAGKAALAQAIAAEKQQQLADQVDSLLQQLLAEQQANTALQRAAQEREEQLAVTRDQLAERDRQLSEASSAQQRLTAALEAEQSKHQQLQSEVDKLRAEKEAATSELSYLSSTLQQREAERDEATQALAIVQEERDLAVAHEEELFIKLGEANTELEEIREGYVHLADRFNDAQDELSEAREQIESLKEAQAAALRTSLASANDIISAVNRSNNDKENATRAPGKDETSPGDRLQAKRAAAPSKKCSTSPQQQRSPLRIETSSSDSPAAMAKAERGLQPQPPPPRQQQQQHEIKRQVSPPRAETVRLEAEDEGYELEYEQDDYQEDFDQE